MEVNSTRITKSTIVFIACLLAILIIAVVLLSSISSTKQPKTINSVKSSTTNNKQQTLTTVKAGGMTVPTKWQAKAESLGYYCPSWDASPGQITSGVCYPLDKSK
jgi:Tfp pilus assembly protein PilV